VSNFIVPRLRYSAGQTADEFGTLEIFNCTVWAIIANDSKRNYSGFRHQTASAFGSQQHFCRPFAVRPASAINLKPYINGREPVIEMNSRRTTHVSAAVFLACAIAGGQAAGQVKKADSSKSPASADGPVPSMTPMHKVE
jgi:hypothetical protein